MLERLKRALWGQPDHQPLAPPSAAPDATLDELVQTNIDLGAQIDDLREQRRVLKARIDGLIAERDAPKENT